MALPLEANSLSSITQLAGNPPKFPRSPTEKKRDPLVLYIARVPGKKDIILTTMKPRLKNVTAEDVMNSLYYLHLDLPSDALLLGKTQPVEDIGRAPRLPKDREAIKPLVRDSNMKQLPELSLEFDQQLHPGSGTLRSPHRPDQKMEKLQSASVGSRPTPPSCPAPTVEVSPIRRPLGPRPFILQSQNNKQPLPGDENIPIRSKPSSAISTSGYMTRLSESERPSQHEPQSNVQSRGRNLELGSISDHSPVQNPFSITFIRRDPASAAQWNIGKIRANALAVRPSSNIQLKNVFEKRCTSILVHLTNPGYGQFEASPILSHIEEDDKSQQRLQIALDAQFEREVRLAASGFRSGKSREHRRGSSDQSAISKSAYTRDSLGNLGWEIEESGQENRVSLLEVPECGFLSPWNGSCNFSTGNSGRTLKCKHTLPNSTSANNISELRFNLPSIVTSGVTTRSLASSPASGNKSFGNSKTGVKSSLSAEFRKSRPRSQLPHPTSYAAMYPSSDDDDDDDDGDGDGVSRNSLSDRVDPLGLGREKAGGGIRGKRAKLGKLIVYDEGLKMLDLVVAANMGVWWTIWDR